MRINGLGVRCVRAVKRSAILLPLCATFLVGHLAGGTISYQVTSQGADAYRYEFFLSDLGLQHYQEFDIQFDPSLFGGLFNGVANNEFRLSLLQPGNPAGAFGHYSAMALVNNPSPVGPFFVDVEWLGTGSPGALPYLLHQFDPTGQQIVGTIGSGFVGAPEPTTWSLGGAGLVIMCIGWLLRTARWVRTQDGPPEL